MLVNIAETKQTWDNCLEITGLNFYSQTFHNFSTITPMFSTLDNQITPQTHNTYNNYLVS